MKIFVEKNLLDFYVGQFDPMFMGQYDSIFKKRAKVTQCRCIKIEAGPWFI